MKQHFRIRACFVIVVTLLVGYTSAYAQAQKVTIHLQNSTLKDVFSEIEKQTTYRLSYRNVVIDNRNDINVSKESETVEAVLDEVFSNRNLKYSIVSPVSIVIAEKTQPASVESKTKRKVTGVIKDNTGEPIIGATVLETGTMNGTTTDFDGNFNIDVPDNARLHISYVGYSDQDIAVDGKSIINIILYENVNMLEEFVVVGYGVQRKSVLTGAISSIKAEDMMNSSITRPEQGLQGKTSGVQVLSSSGSPGAGIKIRVRGFSSNGNSDPLYIVDGLRTTDISTLEPSNIESMEVLKDGASAAIYGAEGGNGVVLITTKNGKAGQTQVAYDFQYTIQSLGKSSKMLNGSQYLDYMQQAGQIASGVTSTTNTNWIDEVFEASPMQKHNLSVSGGNEKVTYLGSLSYLDQDGIVVGDYDNYKRYSLMFNGSVQANKWMKLTSSIQINRSNRKSFNENDESRGVVAGALLLDPLTPVYYSDNNNLPTHVQNLLADGRNLMTDDDGHYYGISQYVTGEAINPLVQRNLRQVKTTNSSLIGNVALDITPFSGFTFTSRLGINFNQYNQHIYQPEYFYNNEMYNSMASVSEADATTTYWQWENYANYRKSFNMHNFTFMLGTAISENEYKTVNAQGYPLLKDQESFADLDFISSQAGSQVGGTTLIDRKMSFFGRINYNYNDTYLLEATLRRDGAGLSILPQDKRWGLFPSVSAGWIASNESFFPKTDFIDYAKMRVSWGVNGSLGNLGNYAYASNISSSGTGYSYLTWSYINTSYLYPSSDGTYQNVSIPSSLGNYNLTWETSNQFDVGMDFRFLKNRLTLSMDYFYKKTEDLITENTPALESGNSASPINGGNVVNKGFEFELGWRDNIGDFGYSINANLSTLKNKVTHLDPSISRIAGVNLQAWDSATAFEQGHSVWYFRGFKTDGLTPEGAVNIVDMNDDGVINSDDLTDIGSPIPDITYGVTLNASYKGFDFTAFVNGSAGNDILYGVRRPNRQTTNRLEIFYTDAWSTSNPNGKFPSIENQMDMDFWRTDMMIFDGSYMKIKQLQLGYSLPGSVLDKVGVSKLRVYASLDDFFTFTSYKGMDPEATTSANNSTGVDRGFYPNSKKVLFGLLLTF